MNSVDFLDAVRAKHGLESDRKLARFLGIDRSRMPNYRAGRRKLDPDACVAVAKALELPPEHVFAAVAAERAKRTEHRRIWERLAKLAKTAHVLVVVGVVAVGALGRPSSADAGAVLQQAIHYAHCRAWAAIVAVAARRSSEASPPPA
ncbi:MAG TPA: helix-turn-helix transcriptional regulator, partial [Gammaproteobacteria bacterium]|nr:helix-turn-helix transcriptional regulator [Gammaproteobacteria bacterium]